MAIEIRRVGGTLVIQADHRLDSASAQTFQGRLDTAIGPAQRAVVVDMAELSYISCGL